MEEELAGSIIAPLLGLLGPQREHPDSLEEVEEEEEAPPQAKRARREVSDKSETVPHPGSTPGGGAGFIIKSAHVCMLCVVPCSRAAHRGHQCLSTKVT